MLFAVLQYLSLFFLLLLLTFCISTVLPVLNLGCQWLSASLWSPRFRVYLIYNTWFCMFYFALWWEQEVSRCTRQITSLRFERQALTLAQVLNNSKVFHLPEVSLSVQLGLSAAQSRDTHLLPVSVASLGKRSQLHLLSVGIMQSNKTCHQMTP